MMMDLLQKRKVAWLLLFPCMVSFQLLAQKVNLEADGAVLKKYMKTITAEELKDHLYILGF
jgi:hypothetical protein